MRVLGVEFASWNVPLHRRVQTFTVFVCITGLMFTGVLSLVLLVYLLFTHYYYLAFLYLTWFYYDWKAEERGGRPKQWLKRLQIWRTFASYFPISLVKTTELDPTKNYVFGFHPHGIGGLGCIINFVTDATGFCALFPGIKAHVLTLAENFFFPIHRELLLGIGFCSVSKESINWILSNKGPGNAVVIVVGGAAEALDARPGEATLTLKHRKGFVRQAIKNGAYLVPIYSFGENDLYNQVSNPIGSPLRTFQDRMRKILGVSSPIINGRGMFNYTFGYLPHRRKIVSVVGKPILVQKNETPSQEEVDKVHSEYLQQLTLLYNEHKEKYGNPNKELIIN